MSAPPARELPLGAILLAGGRSRRMGAPKPWLQIDGAPLLARLVERIASVASPVVVVAAADIALPELPDGTVVERDAEPERGPLEGMRVGLLALAAAKRGAAFVASTDLPLLVPELVTRLAEIRGDAPAAIPTAQGRLHPLAAVYALRVLPVIEVMLAEGDRRVTSLARRVGAVIADPSTLLADPALSAVDPALDSLFNMNTPEQYAEAVRRAGRRGR